jgi:hypothetical protein
MNIYCYKIKAKHSTRAEIAKQIREEKRREQKIHPNAALRSGLFNKKK